MSGFIDSIKNYPYLWVIFVVLVIVTVFVWKKASAASKKHSKRFNEMYEKQKHEAALRELVRDASVRELLDGNAEAVIIGLGLSAEDKIGKEADINAAFEALSDGEKYAYAMRYFIESDGPADFFRSFSRPTSFYAAECVFSACPAEYGAPVRFAFEMTDEENEEISFDEKLLSIADDDFKKLGKAEFYKNIRDFIVNTLDNRI